MTRPQAGLVECVSDPALDDPLLQAGRLRSYALRKLNQLNWHVLVNGDVRQQRKVDPGIPLDGRSHRTESEKLRQKVGAERRGGGSIMAEPVPKLFAECQRGAVQGQEPGSVAHWRRMGRPGAVQ